MIPACALPVSLHLQNNEFSLLRNNGGSLTILRCSEIQRDGNLLTFASWAERQVGNAESRIRLQRRQD